MPDRKDYRVTKGGGWSHGHMHFAKHAKTTEVR